LKEESRIKLSVNNNGDTLINLTIIDAKTILADLLLYEYSDELLKEYIYRDSIKTEIIVLSKEQINNLTNRKDNLETIIDNMTEIIKNKDREIEISNQKIIEKDKIIKKHIIHKKLIIIGALITHIVIIILLG
jgi:hypothetical protein